jgi:hypothetical protein
MGAAHNNSLDVGNSARRKASTRTPVHFYLSVPMYEYDLQCGTRDRIHTFQSRTPVVPAEEHDDSVILWCDHCQNYTKVEIEYLEPLNRPISTDELTAFEQDKGLLRERIAMAIQDAGYLESEIEIVEMALLYGVPVAEIQKINAGLRAPEVVIGEDLCKAGLHVMTVDNIALSHGRRQCKACRTEAQRVRRALKKQ